MYYVKKFLSLNGWSALALRLRNVLEILAWAVLLIVLMLLIVNFYSFLAALSGSDSEQDLSYEEIKPRVALQAVQKIALECVSEPGGANKKYKPIARLKYDSSYNTYVDKESVAILGGSQSNNRSERILRCTEIGLLRSIQFRRLQRDIIWVYVALETGQGRYVLAWPAVSRSLSKDIYRSVEMGRGRNRAFRFRRSGVYEDPVTGGTIFSLHQRQRVEGSIEIESIVGVRAASVAGTFRFVIFLNFCTLIVFCLINVAAYRQFKIGYVGYWYGAWLCWALIYAGYALVYLARVPYVDYGVAHVIVDYMGPVLSIANNGFFLLLALSVLGWRVRAWRYRIAVGVSAIAVVMFVLASWLSESGVRSPVVNPRIVDSLFSFVVSIFLGLAFFRMLDKRPSTISRMEFFGARLSKAMIGGFFVLFALHQLAIAMWREVPNLENLFWVLSLIMKVSLMAVFYLLIVLDRYWGEGEIGLIVLNKLAQGIFAVDAEGLVINANDAAAAALKLGKEYIVGRNIKAILFRSLFESDKFYRDLEASGYVEARKMLTKDYNGSPDIGSFRDLHRLVGAQVVGERGKDKVYALFYLD